MLPRSLFEEKTGEQQVATESEIFYLVEKVTYENGIKSWLKGAEYPQKGQAPAETLFYLGMSKRILVESFKLSSKLPIIFGFLAGQLVLPKRYKLSIEGILEVYNSILWKVISPYILKQENMMDFSREIRKFTYVFLREINVKEEVARQFSAIFSHFFEYDNAYRYRLQDLFNESTEEKLTQNPIKELGRLSKINQERDVEVVSTKFKSGIKLLQAILLVPKFKKAFKEAMTFVDFKKLQYDEIDIYWISMRNDYLYLGEDVITRSKRNEGKKIPIPMPKHEYEAYVKDLQQNNNEVMILRSIDVLLKNEKYKKIIKDKLKK
jgi:hypothetical protein